VLGLVEKHRCFRFIVWTKRIVPALIFLSRDKSVLGTKEVFVKIEMQTEGLNDDSYATVQHSWDRGKRGAVFELKAKLE
jgi:hypothetical protein